MCQHSASELCQHCGAAITRPRCVRDSRKYCGKACYFAAVRHGTQRFKGRLRDAWAKLADWAHAWESQRPKPLPPRPRKARPVCRQCKEECKSRAAKFCSMHCANLWRGSRVCGSCGVRVAKATCHGLCRCRGCQRGFRAAANKRQKTKYGRNHRQRAKHHGVRYVAVPVRDVYERDGWKCQICGNACLRRFVVSKKDGRPHPRSPSIDHIVSMKDGGNHEPSNLQLACFACNTLKGAASRGQLRLEFV